MQVAVIGANGGIGRELLPRLAEAGHDPIGIVREKSQFDAVRDRGGEPRLGDLEGEFESALEGADAVVFTAGSGGNTGWDKTLLVDLWGARRSVDACLQGGIDRYVMISAHNASDPLAGGGAIRPYRVAKRCADDYLEWSSIDATILRPTTLTDEKASGSISAEFEYHGGERENIARADVAGTTLACLENEATVGETIGLFGGDTPIERAIDPDG